MQNQAYPGDKAAIEILKNADCIYTLGELKALLAGTLMGFEFVPPGVVLDHIEFGAIDNPEFADKEMATSFLNVFFGLWNQAASHREPNNPFSFSHPDRSWTEEDADKWIKYADILELEVGTFLTGLELSETPTLVDLIKKKGRSKEDYLPQVMASLSGELLKEVERITEKKSKDVSLIIELSKDIESEIKRLQGRFLKEMSDLHAPPKPSQRAEPKVGRNDPCPCGSGRKFKQCCLQ